MGQIEERLIEALGENAVLTGDDAKNRGTGWGRSGPNLARAVVRPGSTEEVSKALAVCSELGVSVIAQGGLTGLVGGTVPDSTQICLSLERMNTIEEVDVLGRTMTVQAGVPLQAVQERADEVRAGGLQRFALDLQPDDAAEQLLGTHGLPRRSCTTSLRTSGRSDTIPLTPRSRYCSKRPSG